MKRNLLLIFVFLIITTMQAQDISGSWNGKLSIQGIQLRVVFNITKTDTGYSSTMDSPDQGAKGIPVNTTTFENATLKMEILMLGIKYEATLNEENVLTGTFQQRGMSLPLELNKGEAAEVRRPQTPKEPYPYYCEEVKFKNAKANIEFAGTLTLPQKTGVFPAVILITGSGAQNRDEELFGHKPFLVLSDFLTKNGIAVLRYDDRGTAGSTGDFNTATTYDFATDVQSAITYLKRRKEIDYKKIGLIGHSEGGIIAPMVASENKDVDFIVLMAGTALRGDKLLLLQKRLIETQVGINPQEIENKQQIFKGAYDIVLNEKIDSKLLPDTLFKYIDSQNGTVLSPEEEKLMISQLSNPWLINFIRLDPVEYLSKVKCPVLAINGSKDIQVPAKENLSVMEDVFKGDKNKKVKELPGLNHLFQECETGAVIEYGTIEQTISPIALNEMLDWIKELVK